MAEEDLKTEAKPKSKAGTPKGRKIYKGKVVTAKKLMEKLSGIVPVQPMQRQPEGAPSWMKLPPTFMLTKFSPGHSSGRVVMHYYDPAKKTKGQMEVGEEFEINLLQGRRGGELATDFEAVKKTALQQIVSRINCTVGTDPEIFAVDTKGEVIPAWTYLGGKDSPVGYTASGPFSGECYWDGFQAEFNTPPGLTCLENMSQAVRAGLNTIKARAGKMKGTLSHKSVVEVSDQVLASCAPEHVAFGCSPSKNVYGLKGNIKDGRDVRYRFAGGHIHLGLEDRREARLQTLVRGLDTVLGVACVSLFASFDNPVRRQYYGQPGEYRTPPHGLEYRVLSNAWLLHPIAYNVVFDLARAVCGLADDGFIAAWNSGEEETIGTILNHDVDRARDILQRNDTLFTSVIRMAQGYYAVNPGPAKNLFLKGLESGVKNPEDISANWHLGSDESWYGAYKTYGATNRLLEKGAKL